MVGGRICFVELQGERVEYETDILQYRIQRSFLLCIMLLNSTNCKLTTLPLDLPEEAYSGTAEGVGEWVDQRGAANYFNTVYMINRLRYINSMYVQLLVQPCLWIYTPKVKAVPYRLN